MATPPARSGAPAKPNMVIFLLFLFLTAAHAQTPPEPFMGGNPLTGSSKIKFDEPVHNFGAAQQGTPVRNRFTFKNIGTGDLVIFSAKGSCGCTAAAVSTGPFKPGEEGTLNVEFDSRGKFGRVYKDVRVDSNDPSSPATIALEGMIMEPAHPAMAPGEVLFNGSCAECHALPAEGKSGKELYEAVCSMCHDPSDAHKKTAADRMGLALVPSSALKGFISDGLPGTSMPGFAAKHGGPLTKKQIKSLIHYLESLKTAK